MGVKGLCKWTVKIRVKNSQRQIFEEQRRLKEEETARWGKKTGEGKTRLQTHGQGWVQKF